ncbi:hypothetical protein AB0K51_33290 [Kitasatospora sp. NPDC049285]|uniref:hypothetical protein n=1 Tax=Kitasatospora sp. NPDC049285 TaxID=3157096 RepID=UPI003415675E
MSPPRSGCAGTPLFAAGSGFGEYLSLAAAPPEARVGGRSVLPIPAPVPLASVRTRCRRTTNGC